MLRFIDIYSYYNYRLLLKDYYLARKGVDSRFSYRFFALRAGYNSSGLYSNVAQGIRNLTDVTTEKFIKALELTSREADYFRLMVRFTHAVSEKARDEIFREMISYHPVSKRRLSSMQRELFSRWYHVAVHRLLAVVDFQDNIGELATALDPPIRVPDLRRSLQLLKELDLVRQDDRGFWRPVEDNMVGGKEVGVMVIHDFQNAMMEMAKEAQHRFSSEQRHIVSNTVSTSRKGMEKLKERIAVFQKEVMDIVRSEENDERVYQVNIQFFPLSRVFDKGQRMSKGDT